MSDCSVSNVRLSLISIAYNVFNKNMKTFLIDNNNVIKSMQICNNNVNFSCLH